MDTIDSTPPREGSIDISTEMAGSFINYSMSVIVSRAIPDARDGLKPVHRRILYGMEKGGYHPDKPFRKSARIVGEVMGQFHPHGDSAIYETMVRLAQDFSMSLPLVQGQGNFGSIDADPAAAMRYTEARLSRAAGLLTADLHEETVDWRPNYDGSQDEPVVLPASFPNLLVNGTEGIAVGMATRIPPHNAREATLAAIALLDDPSISLDGLMAIIPGPDFPTGGIIVGRAGIREAYETGRGSIVLRARHTVEVDKKGRRSLVFTEMPYQVVKKHVVTKIAELARDKQIDGIAEVRDESDREGIRVVIDLRKDADEDVLLARLHRLTSLQVSYPANMIAIDHGRPRQFTLKSALQAFLDFRIETVRRRTKLELRQARERIHTRAGLLVALANVDQVIKLIREAADTAAARVALMGKTLKVDADLAALIQRADPRSEIRNVSARLTEAQADAILDLKLHRLTGLERDKLAQEAKDLAQRIDRRLAILASQDELRGVVRTELADAAERFKGERRSSIEEGQADYLMEDLIKREDMIVTFTHSGYVKRCPLSAYKSQKRGGKGRNGMETKDDDFVTRVLTTNTHAPLLLFTEDGRAFKLKVYQLPLGEPQGRGRPLVNVVPAIKKDDRIAAILELPEDEETWKDMTAVFCTEKGDARRNTLADFREVRASGKMAMKLVDENGEHLDRLIGVLIAGTGDDVMLTTAEGQVTRFAADDIRVFSGRSSTGVRGIRLGDGDRVISAMAVKHFEISSEEVEGYLKKSVRGADGEAEGEAAELTLERLTEIRDAEQWVLTVTDAGFGKRTSSVAYRITNRGGKGVRDRSTAAKAGSIVATLMINPADDLVIITDGGQTIRLPADQVRATRRCATGVKLIDLKANEKVVSVSTATRAEDDLLAEADTAP